MTAENYDPGRPALVAHQVPGRGERVPTDQPAVQARQSATSGAGAAIDAVSDNPDGPTIRARGVGDLLDLLDADGATVLRVTQDGASLAAGDVETTTGAAAKITAHSAATDPHGDRAYTDTELLTRLAPDVIAPAATGVAATDTANLAAAITATPDNGWLHVRRGEYKLNAPLVLNKHMRMTGAGVFNTNGTVTSGIADAPLAAPFLSGTVFTQTVAGTDAVQLSGAGCRVDLADFGIKFDTSIQFSDTGHGINATPPVVGSFHDNGLSLSLWRNLHVFGHDGNHYAFYIINPMHNTLELLRSYGGGVIFMKESSGSINYGNTLVLHSYGALITAGTADGYHIESPSSGSQRLNLVTFVRPQCNVMDYTAKAAYAGVTQPLVSQNIWNSVGSTLLDILVISPDLECNNSGIVHPIVFTTNMAVLAEGGFSTNPMWYRPRKPYNRGYAPAIAAGSGAGTGPTVSINAGPNQSTDLVGIMNITSGTSPGAAGTNIATLTFATPSPVIPAAIMLTPVFNAPPGVFYVSAMSTTAWTVRCSAPLAASTQYQIAYRVEQ